nr:hypothetical protein [Planococcus glaciei]
MMDVNEELLVLASVDGNKEEVRGLLEKKSRCSLSKRIRPDSAYGRGPFRPA